MKIIKITMSLIAICLLTLSLLGCKDESIETDRVNEDNISELLEYKDETSNFITEDEIWNEANIIAKDTFQSYGNNTIEGLKIVSDKAKENAENTIKTIDESLLETTIQKIKESYNSDKSIEGLYRILYVDGFIKDKLWSDYINVAKNSNDDEEKKQAFEYFEESSKQFSDLYSPIIKLLRKEDISNKH